MSNRFLDKLSGLLAKGQAPLCIGLDPHPERLPDRYPDLLAWNRAVIEQTADLAACFKPNIAFYEALGSDGHGLLADTLAAIPENIPVILDAKRGDIESTAAAYARACFEGWNVDAVTLSPYLGADSVRPFTSYSDRYVFVLCHTSNPSAGEVQWSSHWGMPLYQRIASQAQHWGDGNAGLVIGATYPEALADVRALAPDVWFLVPGVGAQGGDAANALQQGANAEGRGVLINVSRGISLADDHRQAAQSYIEKMLVEPEPVQPQILSHQMRKLALMLHGLGCIRFGEFTLASGKQSPVYIDLRLLVSDTSALALAAQIYAKQIAGLVVDRLAGVPYAALPIATAVSLETGLPLIYPRKEVKTYGRGQAIESIFNAEEHIVVIEDLVTSAGSLLKCVEVLRGAGLEIRDAVVLIDREQGGSQNLALAGVRLHAASTFLQLLDVLREQERINAEQYASVRDYLGTN